MTTKRELTEDDFEELLRLKHLADNADPVAGWVGKVAGYQAQAGKMAPALIEEIRELRLVRKAALRALDAYENCSYDWPTLDVGMSALHNLLVEEPTDDEGNER